MLRRNVTHSWRRRRHATHSKRLHGSRRHISNWRNIASRRNHSWISFEGRRHVACGRHSEALRSLAEGRSHGRVRHGWGRNVSETTSSNRCRFVASWCLKVEAGGNSGRLSVSWCGHAEVNVGSADVGSGSSHVALITVHGSSHGLFISGSFRFLLSFHLSVLDVDSIFVDVSLLMVRPQLPVLVTLHEDGVVAGSDGDVVVELLDVFFGEFVEEVDDQPSGNFIDFDP